MAFSGGFLAVKPKLEQNITKHVPRHRFIEKLALKNATAGKYFVLKKLKKTINITCMILIISAVIFIPFFDYRGALLDEK